MTLELISTTGSRSQSSRANVNAIGLFFGSQVEDLTGFRLNNISSRHVLLGQASLLYPVGKQIILTPAHPPQKKRKLVQAWALWKKVLSFVYFHSCDLVAMRRSSKARWPGLEPWLCHLPAVWHRASDFLCHCFLVSKIEKSSTYPMRLLWLIERIYLKHLEWCLT